MAAILSRPNELKLAKSDQVHRGCFSDKGDSDVSAFQKVIGPLFIKVFAGK